MYNILFIKSSDNLINTINLLDIGKELVSKTMTLVSSFDKPGNINYSENWRDSVVGLENVTEFFKARICYFDESTIGFNGAEGEIFSWNIESREQIECAAFTDVGHSYNTHFQ